MGTATRRGRPMSAPGGMIAAIALAHTSPLATRNSSDFATAGIAIINPWGRLMQRITKPSGSMAPMNFLAELGAPREGNGYLVPRAGIEPAAFPLGGGRSIHWATGAWGAKCADYAPYWASAI
jgi:hypothetical protein